VGPVVRGLVTTYCVPRGVRPRAYVDMVSQLYHFEKRASRCSGASSKRATTAAFVVIYIRRFADETRHAGIYRAYLERLGDMAPINEGLRILLDVASGRALVPQQSRSSERHDEADAERQQNAQIEKLPCPLLRQISRLVAQDELGTRASARST